MTEISFKKIKEDAMMLSYATEGSAAADIFSYCPESILLAPQERVLVGTGISLAIPQGYVGLVFARSGLASRGITLSNSVGVIDSDYRGELKVALHNASNEDFLIEHQQRLAQLAIMPVLQCQFVEKLSLPQTERGSGGFGSTGI